MLSATIQYRQPNDAFDAERRQCLIVAPTPAEIVAIFRHVHPDAECATTGCVLECTDTEISYQDTTTNCNRSEKRRKLRTKRQTAGR